MHDPAIGLVEPDWVECSSCGESWAPAALILGLCDQCRPEPEPPIEPPVELKMIPPRYAALAAGELLPSVDGWTGDPWCVTFEGANGRGKTTMATRLFATIATRRSVWMSAKEFVEALRQSVRNDGPSPAAALAGCDVLLLDDVRAIERGSSGMATDFAAESLEYVLCHRYDWLKPTILTTDKPFSELAPRLVRRVVRSGLVVQLRGDDLTQKAHGRELP
jgi:hypothetical protein